MAATYELLASVTLAADASFIEFTSIPSTYDDLIILTSLKSDRANAADSGKITFNNVTTSTYSARILFGTGSSVSSVSESSLSYMAVYQIATGTTATANTFANGEMYIPNYAGSTAKSLSATTVTENNSTAAFMAVTAGIWTVTSAITSIKIDQYVASNWKTGSTAYLYGITKA